MLEALDAHKAAMARPGSASVRMPARRSLVVLAPHGAVADCILDALKREYPWLSVELCADIGEAGRAFDDPVCLFLVDRGFLLDVDRLFGVPRHLHPGAAVAVMLDDVAEADALLPVLLACRTLRGILPMNLKLDLWLSVVGLLMRGGEYVPAALLRACARSRPHAADTHPPDMHPDIHPGTQPAHAGDTVARRGGAMVSMQDLTERERQVLGLVARGRQNKLIATDLNLSEHTVKIHIHNVIRKLRVHNRTEAAALYLRAASARPAEGSVR